MLSYFVLSVLMRAQSGYTLFLHFCLLSNSPLFYSDSVLITQTSIGHLAIYPHLIHLCFFFFRGVVSHEMHRSTNMYQTIFFFPGIVSPLVHRMVFNNCQIVSAMSSTENMCAPDSY